MKEFCSNHIFSHAGTFNVTLKTYIDGAVLKTVNKPVTLNPVPLIELGNEKVICKGETVPLAAQDEGYV